MKTTSESGSKDTTFSFSSAEINALTDTGFFEMKRRLIEKILYGLGDLEQLYLKTAINYSESVPPGWPGNRGKISKGENYRGLPYLVLDFPAIFQKQNIFAFRTMFWWGAGFSYTFLSTGDYMQPILRKADSAIKDERFTNILVCTNSTPWEHHFDPGNYLQVKEYLDAGFDFYNEGLARNFIKFTRRLPIENSTSLQAEGVNFMEMILDATR